MPSVSHLSKLDSFVSLLTTQHPLLSFHNTLRTSNSPPNSIPKNKTLSHSLFSLSFQHHRHPIFKSQQNHSTVFGEEIKLIPLPIAPHRLRKKNMSLKPSNSSENPMLPVSDPGRGHEGGADKLFKGSAMTKRGAHAAVSYMSCAGRLFPSTKQFIFPLFF